MFGAGAWDFRFRAGAQGGLDPTAFNKSNHVAREGKLSWPSTESGPKFPSTKGARLIEFVSYVGDGRGSGLYRNIPLFDYFLARAERSYAAVGCPHPNSGRGVY